LNELIQVQLYNVENRLTQDSRPSENLFPAASITCQNSPLSRPLSTPYSHSRNAHVFAPLKPAEFVVIQIQQIAGQLA